MNDVAIRAHTPRARVVLAATVLGSGIVFLDGTVVNIALPTIDDALHGGTAGLQWTIDAYLVTLTALLLLGGTLGDRFGRRRLFRIGLIAFTAASVACGAAPTMTTLIIARAVQGIGGALLVPGSLAIITTSFDPDDRAWAVGAWSGMAGIATAIAPFLGGWLIDAVSWRAVFFINVPLALVALALTPRVPESHAQKVPERLDYTGAVLGSVTLAAAAYALIEAHEATAVVAAVLAFAGLVGFLIVESRVDSPMLPLGIFRSMQFSGANLTTLAMYGGLGGATFLAVLQLQYVLGYSALAAGATLLPMSVLLLLFSASIGRLSARIGPRWLMTAGPIVSGIGLVWFATIRDGTSLFPTIIGASVVFGVGLTLVVSPLTATAMGALDDNLAGLASGVNNAVARGAGLLAVAFLPAVVGLRVDGPADEFTTAYRAAMLICAGLCIVGGVVAAAMIRNPTVAQADDPSTTS